ncbi:hypothetical protein BH11PAT4_BH11PAT4_7090 [soil metagenome]
MKRLNTVVLSIVVVAIVAVAGYFILARGNSTVLTGGVVKDSGDNLSDFSAVFVNGGGIYFGKITKMNDDVVVLEEVYNYGVVPATDASGKEIKAATGTTQETRPTLFDASKVGIAPASKYNINRGEVILWYSLKNDSDVVKTIAEYKKS